MFSFIWTHSKRDQLVLLIFTIALFPFLFLTLELPKRIINDAIGAGSRQIEVLGVDLDQVTFLWLLCGTFLAAVLAHGLMKMRINTMKGILAERLLRRLRYNLIARMRRFPSAYFERTSQGELVSMVTAETDPMGGIMGDALAQPVMQAGQMLTILFFLFLQSFWFGLAAVALIPLQAWLIPKLQRQINRMNKERIREVRTLASLIGESAAGAGTLRAHGGWRYRLAQITRQLGAVYRIRFQIYQKKFFMKFLNNFITQLTPFFFFAVGGYLVIEGSVSLGALVAALAAYKDLSAPWKELLVYYNQAADMTVRWEILHDRFSPAGMLDARLFEDEPEQIPHLDGALELEDVTVTDADGNPVLENVSARFAKGALVGIEARNDEDRQAFSAVVTREVLPSSGRVTIDGQDLSRIHQSVIAARIGHANSRPILFQGSFGENALMPLRPRPPQGSRVDDDTLEATRAGNSPDTLTTEWLDPRLAGLDTVTDLRSWWLSLVDAMGSGSALFRRSLDQDCREDMDPALANRLVEVRPKVWAAIEAAGLQRHVHRFDPETYNPALGVANNLFYATLRRPMNHEELAEQTRLFELLRELGQEETLLELSTDVIEMLAQIFGTDGTEHPLFRNVGLDPRLFEAAARLVLDRKGDVHKPLSEAEKIMLMTLPAQLPAEQFGAQFSKQIQDRVLKVRAAHAEKLRVELSDIFVAIDPDRVAPGLSVLENVLFGMVSDRAGARAEEVRKIVSDVLDAEGLRNQVMQLIYDLQMSHSGLNLPALFAEPLALSRATVKRPDILVLDQILASYDSDARQEMHENLRKLMPDTTMIYLSDAFGDAERFDQFLEIRQGRVVSAGLATPDIDESHAGADLTRKLRALESTDLFSGLSRKQLRLLAFGAKWYSASADEIIFNKDDDPGDGAYMILSGSAGLYDPLPDGTQDLVATVGPGRLVGELGLIRNVPRALTMRAHTDVEALRLGAEEFLAVVENDASTAFKLLQVVAGYAGH
ncbi:ABC transporter transmembrane domain-containing protein [Sulfitobacter sp. D35]|uniref:ABC transporter transmembrane domain-containing protein n=1 Tax=Sulfitobacter sp. D35 TaxID=3083252 RepID=UPI00296EB627|nr:ABC transporter transmembrane domain-containing protein [Sulfitobacter sp. D35]MDW4496505.1 ABC transporter transmembrane domain-containing protein [Sulfitobacter sp. D35]